MAGDIIKADDVFAPDLYKGVIAAQEAYNKALKEGIALIEQQKSIGGSLAGNKLNSSADVKQLNKDLSQSILLEQKQQQAAAKTAKMVADAAKKQLEYEQKKIKAQQQSIKETDKQTAAQKKLNSEYGQATAALNKLERRQLDNVIAGRNLSKTGLLVADAHTQMRLKVEAAEQSVGRFQRNVGNYHDNLLKYGKGLRAVAGLGKIAAEVFGIDTAAMETGLQTLSETGKVLKEYEHAKKAATAATEGQTIATEAETVAEEEQAAATAVSTGGISLLIAGIIAAGAAIYVYISRLRESNDEERKAAELKERTLTLTKQSEEAVKRETKSLKDINDLNRQQLVFKRALLTAELDLQAKRYLEASKSKMSEAEFQKISDDYEELIDLKKKLDEKILEMDKKTNDKIVKEKFDLGKKLADIQIKENEESQKKQIEQIKAIDEEQKLWEEAIKEASEAADKGGKEESENLKKRLSERKKILEEQINQEIDFIQQSLSRKDKLQEQQLNNDLDMRQRNIIQQQQLAEQGYANTLAFEKAAAAKDELQKQQLAQKEEKREKALVFLKLLAAYADKGDPDQALSKTLVQMAIAGAIAGSYIEGTENVKDDLKGNKMHNGKDGYVIAVDGDERILNPKQNAKVGSMSNDELAQLAYNFQNGYIPAAMTDQGGFAENVSNSIMIHQMAKFIDKANEIVKAVKEKPVASMNIDKDGVVSKSEFRNGLLKVSRSKPSSPLNYL